MAQSVAVFGRRIVGDAELHEAHLEVFVIPAEGGLCAVGLFIRLRRRNLWAASAVVVVMIPELMIPETRVSCPPCPPSGVSSRNKYVI